VEPGARLRGSTGTHRGWGSGVGTVGDCGWRPPYGAWIAPLTGGCQRGAHGAVPHEFGGRRRRGTRPRKNRGRLRKRPARNRIGRVAVASTVWFGRSRTPSSCTLAVISMYAVSAVFGSSGAMNHGAHGKDPALRRSVHPLRNRSVSSRSSGVEDPVNRAAPVASGSGSGRPPAADSPRHALGADLCQGRTQVFSQFPAPAAGFSGSLPNDWSTR
jgi:hypothetical protein